ncbi:hypothetical protein [Lysobacter gummosus]
MGAGAEGGCCCESRISNPDSPLFATNAKSRQRRGAAGLMVVPRQPAG